MKIIKVLTKKIKCEIEDAESYCDLAMQMKEEDNQTAYELFYKLSQEELNHAMLLHKEAVLEIDKKKEELKLQNIEVPPFMLEYWKDEHAYYVKAAAKVKSMLELSKI